MAVTIDDIAKKIGVTKSTVSRVLNKKSTIVPVSKQTQDRIVEMAREMDYRPSFSARALARGKTFSIGFLCGNIESPYYNEMALMAMREAEAKGYHLLISVTPWISKANNLECLETILSRGIDGLIHFGDIPVGSRLYRRLVNDTFPIVILHEQVEGLSSVTSEWEPGMDAAVAHLQAKGHTRIGYVRPSVDAADTDPKYQAFSSVCRRRGVELVLCKAGGEPRGGREGGRQFARDPHHPAAVVVCCDHAAIGFLSGLRMEGLDIPRDVAVIGVDGTEMGEFLHPPLTSIAQDRQGFIRNAMEMILAMIEKKEKPGRRVFLPTKLVVREST